MSRHLRRIKRTETARYLRHEQSMAGRIVPQRFADELRRESERLGLDLTKQPIPREILDIEAAAEREAIATWLHHHWTLDTYWTYEHLAQAIRNGDHHKETQ